MVLTSASPLGGWAGVPGAGDERKLSSNGAGGGPGGSTSCPFRPQPARQNVRQAATILDINDGPVSKKLDVST